MSKLPIFHNFDKAPTHVAPFSHAAESNGWIQLTGQMPTDPDAPDAVLPEGIEAQTHRVMENLRIILAELGLDLSHVVQCRCFLTEFERDYAVFNETYASYFPEDRRPARTTVGVSPSSASARPRLTSSSAVASSAAMVIGPSVTPSSSPSL